MTKYMTGGEKSLILSGSRAGLSAKAAAVYAVLLEEGQAVSPKSLVLKARLHRQYVYDALEELREKRLVVASGARRTTKYQAASPEALLQEAERNRLETLDGVSALMRVYDRSPAGIVEVIRGREACIEAELQLLREAKDGDYLDIVGGAGMQFVKLFKGRIEEWERLRKEKGIKLRYIGSGEDVEHNRSKSIIKNESRAIPGIGSIVNVCIRPDSVSFNIYEPEVLTVRVKSREAVESQKALFEVLWSAAR